MSKKSDGSYGLSLLAFWLLWIAGFGMVWGLTGVGTVLGITGCLLFFLSLMALGREQKARRMASFLDQLAQAQKAQLRQDLKDSSQYSERNSVQ